jgi:hypothetical protein
MDNLGFGSNPYVQKQADAITNQFSNNLTRNVLPQIGSDAQMAGGYGGSRQGVAQGNAVQGSAQALGNSLSSLYGNAYGMDQNFYSQQRAQDQNGAALGANMFGQGNAGYLSQGQGLYGLGQTQQQAPWQTIGNATNNLSPYTGLGSTQLNTQNGSLAGNIAGGALAGGQLQRLYNGGNLGFGNYTGYGGSTGGSNTMGFGGTY